MKSISTINSAIPENTDGMIVKAHTPVIDIKWVSRLTTVYHYALFCFQIFERLATIPSKE